MLYVLTALKCEAAALEGLPGKHIVTGVGAFAEKALEKIALDQSDSMINIGAAASTMPGCYLVNSVTDGDTGRKFYPDMMSDPPLPECALITSSSIVTEPLPGALYDMEASLICKFAMRKIAPSKIAIVKAVSDDGSRRPSANEITSLIRKYRTEIGQIIDCLNREPEQNNYMPLPESVMEELKLTEYMRNEFEDLVHYCVVSGKLEKLESILSGMRSAGTLPVRDKKQGRRVLDEICSRLR